MMRSWQGVIYLTSSPLGLQSLVEALNQPIRLYKKTAILDIFIQIFTKIKYNMHISFQTRPVPKHVPKLPLRQRRAPLPLPPEFGTRARCAGRRAPSARSSRPMLITFILLDKYLEAAANKGRASAAISKLLEAAASSRRRRCSSPTARTLTATHATRQPADRLLRLIAQVYYPTSLSSVSRALEGP